MKKSLNSPGKARAERLGALLRSKREEAGVGPVELTKRSGVNRSYLAYLEQGRFSEVGLDKFSRIVTALGLSADQVLQEAGYLPRADWTLPDAKTYLRERYGLPQKAQEQAMAFLEFLASREQLVPSKKAGRSKK